ncbi:hypothetical protein SCCGRSA3_01590 [Marine Group I thaumarchaeote SCGC RSA3]|uniref:Uncharacterized protein n=2 Tax=Marine Group I TaxID=905826 RepID=A0A081RPT3_9ARCH|nr:hypothetical protein AAA799N04_00156 [Marine Group I thaumarchaeote SCGC AAA799-N04]KFM17660.1 hypothetical protein SCCGRSA3_01590 [Marine Group I thaumarchaeote SCGC RSA3]
MPLDKMNNTEDFIPTHKSVILHLQGKPVSCVIDNQNNYDEIQDNPSLRASLTGFLNKDDELGLMMGFQLKIKTDDRFLQFTVYPDDEFIETLIFDERIFIINEKMDPLFSLKINTDQFVKTKSEFDKFQKMIK